MHPARKQCHHSEQLLDNMKNYNAQTFQAIIEVLVGCRSLLCVVVVPRHLFSQCEILNEKRRNCSISSFSRLLLCHNDVHIDPDYENEMFHSPSSSSIFVHFDLMTIKNIVCCYFSECMHFSSFSILSILIHLSGI